MSHSTYRRTETFGAGEWRPDRISWAFKMVPGVCIWATESVASV